MRSRSRLVLFAGVLALLAAAVGLASAQVSGNPPPFRTIIKRNASLSLSPGSSSTRTSPPPPLQNDP